MSSTIRTPDTPYIDRPSAIDIEENHGDLSLGDERYENLCDLIFSPPGPDMTYRELSDRSSPLHTTLSNPSSQGGYSTDVQDLIGPPRSPSLTEAHHPLLTASLNGRVESVELLLQLGADVDARDGQGCTAAHLAVIYGRQDVLEVLLCHGSDPAAVDKAGNTPLSLAASNGLNQIIILLVEWGAQLR